MRQSALIPLLMFIVGMGIICLAIATGEGEVSLFLIFPVFSGNSGIFLLGTVLIVLSFMIGFLLMVRNQLEIAGFEQLDLGAVHPSKPETKSGGFLLIGPLPIVFGSDRRTAATMFIIAAVLAVCGMIAVLLLILLA